MKAGPLDREITVEQVTVTQTGTGAVSKGWATFAQAWAAYEPMGTRERFLAGAVHSAKTAKFRIRWLSGVDPTMRIQFDGLPWKITGIAEIGRREGLDIAAEAE